MAAITPISPSRVTDSLVRERLLVQLQVDQQAIFKLQNAISTGRRITRPSEDPPASQRGISLQSLLERKTQVGVNVTTTESFLTATDVAMSAISGLLSDIRGEALSVADNVTSTEAKRAVAQQVDRALQQVIDAANQQFRGRYLFAGSLGEHAALPAERRARALQRQRRRSPKLRRYRLAALQQRQRQRGLWRVLQRGARLRRPHAQPHGRHAADRTSAAARASRPEASPFPTA